MKPTLLAACALALIPLSAPIVAHADDANASCTSQPKSHWLSESQVKAKIVAQGFHDVRSVEPMGTCYEVYAKTAKGERAEMYVNPMDARVMRSEED